MKQQQLVVQTGTSLPIEHKCRGECRIMGWGNDTTNSRDRLRTIRDGKAHWNTSHEHSTSQKLKTS